jgi:hypothetical protein
MKRIYILFFAISCNWAANAQKIAFQNIDCIKNEYIDDFNYEDHSYLNNEIKKNLSNIGLNVEQICDYDLNWAILAGNITGESDIHEAGSEFEVETVYSINKIGPVLKKMGFTHVLFCIHRQGNPTNPSVIYQTSLRYGLIQSTKHHEIKFIIRDLISENNKDLTLSIMTSGKSDFSLKSCSDIDQFTKAVKDFVQGNSTSLSSNNDAVVTDNNVSNQQSNSSPKKKKSFFGASDNSEGKLKVVRAKERNSSNNQPVAIDVYDKSLSLKVGDNIIITKTDEVKIPGEKKTIKSETTIGKAKITEDFNKPLYTAKLIANAGFNMKDFKDGDENYNAVKGETTKTIMATPQIMVIPKKFDPSKYVNGEYLLSKEEKMLIAAFKNKFEDNKFTTYGFESSLKSVLENRQFNDNVQDDIKSKILESSGMDFFVEYENLDQNNTKCDKVFDFKIRNYSTGEDVASDVKSLNSCGTPDDYKNFASAILNSGAVSKINTQFASLINNGRKVSVIFTISNSSQANFNKEYNGTKLKDHIENCLQGLAFNGNLDIEGVVNLRMEATVNVPVTNENTGKSYTTNTFSEDVIGYLKKNANVECESSVSKQSVNIKIK